MPKVNKSEVVYVRVDPEFKALVVNESEKYNMSISTYIRFMVNLLSETNIVDLLRNKKPVPEKDLNIKYYNKKKKKEKII